MCFGAKKKKYEQKPSAHPVRDLPPDGRRKHHHGHRKHGAKKSVVYAGANSVVSADQATIDDLPDGTIRSIRLPNTGLKPLEDSTYFKWSAFSEKVEKSLQSIRDEIRRNKKNKVKSADRVAAKKSKNDLRRRSRQSGNNDCQREEYEFAMQNPAQNKTTQKTRSRDEKRKKSAQRSKETLNPASGHRSPFAPSPGSTDYRRRSPQQRVSSSQEARLRPRKSKEQIGKTLPPQSGIASDCASGGLSPNEIDNKKSTPKPKFDSDPVKVLPPPRNTLKSDFTPQMLTGIQTVKSNLESQDSSSEWGKYYSYIGSSEHEKSTDSKK